jgi:drug/metabolite transporter (DMT)-like permease
MKLYHFNLLSTMLLVAFMGISLNYTMFLCIRNNSSLTTVMVGHLKTMAQTLLGFFVLAKDVHSSPLYVFGVLLSFLGGYLFTMAKYYQSSPLGPTGVWTWRWWQDKLFFNTAKDTQDKHTS